MSGGKTMSMTFQIGAALEGGFAKTFKNAGGSVLALGQKINQYNRQAANISRLIRLRDETKALGKEYATQKAKLDKLTEAVVKARNPSASLIAQQARAEKALVKTGDALDRQRESVRKLNRELHAGGASMDELIRRQKRYERLAFESGKTVASGRKKGSLLPIVKSAAMAAGAWASAKGVEAAVPAIMTGAEFQKGMSQTAAVMPTLTSEGRKELEAQALKLGATTEWSSTQVAAGQRAYAMGGFTKDQILAAMGDTLSLASAAGMNDLGQAAKINSVILKGFGMDAGKTGYVADVLTNAFTSGFLDLQYLGDAAKIAGAAAKNARLGLGEFSAMAVALADTGASGSESGTSIRNVVSRLTAPTSQGMNILSALGVRIADKNGKVRHLIEILADIDKQIKDKKLTEVERNNFFKLVFDEATASHARTLVQNAGVGELQRSAVSYEARGSSARVATIQSDNLLGDWASFNSAKEGASIAVFQAVESDLRTLVQLGTRGVAWVGQMATDFPALTKFATLAVSSGGLISAFNLISKIAAVFGIGGGATIGAPVVATGVAVAGAVTAAITNNAADYNKESALEDVRRLANGETESELIYGKDWDAGVVPQMASGGIVTGPTLAMVGEGREAEAVLPLSKLGGMIGQGMTVNYAPVINLTGSGGDAYDDVKRGLEDGVANIKRELERLLNDQRRLSFA